ncbi:MAG: DMT family transporter [Bacteroides sp.]
MKFEGSVKLGARLALLFVAIIWGSTLVVSKSTTGTIHPNLLIALRFLIACVVLGLVFIKRLKKINASYLVSGLVIGFCLFLAHSAQTFGVTDGGGDPGRSGFLSAAYCVIVPFLAWIVNRVRPDRYNIIAAVLCVSGIGLISFGENPTSMEGTQYAGFSLPDALALLSGIFFAAHIVTIERFSREKDPILITILQFLFAGLFGTIAVFVQEPKAIQLAQWSNDLWMAIGYLAIVATAIALLLQNLGQKFTDASSAAIILGTESLFCVLFGVLFANEKITPMLAMGFVLIFAAIFVSETKLSFLRRAKS